MARKPVDTVQINLRLKEGLRRRVERQADRNKVSQTKQILMLIEDGLERQDRLTIADVAADIQLNWSRYANQIHESNKQGDLLRAVEALIAALPADVRERGPVKKAVETAERAIGMIEAEAARALRRAHTAGNEPK